MKQMTGARGIPARLRLTASARVSPEPATSYSRRRRMGEAPRTIFGSLFVWRRARPRAARRVRLRGTRARRVGRIRGHGDGHRGGGRAGVRRSEPVLRAVPRASRRPVARVAAERDRGSRHRRLPVGGAREQAEAGRHARARRGGPGASGDRVRRRRRQGAGAGAQRGCTSAMRSPAARAQRRRWGSCLRRVRRYIAAPARS